MSQDVLRAGFPLLVSYHCTNIFTRDNILGLGTMYFFFAGPHHLDFLSFFFFFLYLSIASAGQKHQQDEKLKWVDDTEPTGDR